jgi:hypothetical protein
MNPYLGGGQTKLGTVPQYSKGPSGVRPTGPKPHTNPPYTADGSRTARAHKQGLRTRTCKRAQHVRFDSYARFIQ